MSLQELIEAAILASNRLNYHGNVGIYRIVSTCLGEGQILVFTQTRVVLLFYSSCSLLNINAKRKQSINDV